MLLFHGAQVAVVTTLDSPAVRANVTARSLSATRTGPFWSRSDAVTR